MEQKFQRSTAKKISIKTINEGEFVNGTESDPSYLKTNESIYKINLIAIVTNKNKQGSITNFLIDDGTGSINSRIFEEMPQLKKIIPGSVVLIVGKVRNFNGEKYVSPEIIKVVDADWLKLRALSLSKESKIINKIEPIIEEKEIKQENYEETQKFPVEKLLDLIKELDSGEGVLIEEVIEKSLMEETENLIEKMLESGDIFQNQPGKIKVL
jgi:RPA family protein